MILQLFNMFGVMLATSLKYHVIQIPCYCLSFSGLAGLKLEILALTFLYNKMMDFICHI